MEVGFKIKSFMDEKGISQAHISRKTGIPTAKLNLALNGKRRLTFEEYETICWALGVEVGAFLEPRAPVDAAAPVAEAEV